MKKITLNKAFALFAALILYVSMGWAQTVTIEARPSQIDLSEVTSQSAVLVTLEGYTVDDARYRLYSGSNQYNCWDGIEYVTSNSYAVGPQVPGSPTTSTTWWILFERGTNNSTAASYRDRLGPAYGSNHLTMALPAATAVTTPVMINQGDVDFVHSDYTEKLVVLAYDAEIDGVLISATSTSLTSGGFELVVEEGTSIQRIELRAIDNTLLESKTGEWPIVEEPADYETHFQFSAIDANLPTWFGSQFARGFAVYGDNLYVANRNAAAGQQVEILNRLTGNVTGFLNTTGVSGGTFPLNDVEVSADGVVLLCNLAQSTGGTFTIYKLDAVNPAEVFITLPLADVGAARLGDKFSVVGSFADGSARIYAADSSTPRIFMWTMTAVPDKEGFAFGAPEVLPLVAGLLGSNASVASLPNGQMYYTAGGANVYKLNPDGSIIGMVPGGLVATGSSAIKYLGTDGIDEVVAVFLYGAGNEKVRVLRIPNGIPADAVIEFDTPTYGTTNSTGNGDVTFVPAADGQNADLYVLSATNGIGGYATNNLNLEFPVYLPMQDPTYTVTFVVEDEDAIAIADAVITFDGMEYAAGVYVFADLDPGTYTYTVVADGYDDATGTVTVVDADVAETVVMIASPPTYTVTFVVEDGLGVAIADAVVTFNGVGNAAGNYVFADVLAGTYAYTVVADGYEDGAGNVVVVDQDVTVTVVMTEVSSFVINEFPYLMDFNAEWAGTPAAPEHWTVINADADAYTWSRANTYLGMPAGDFAAHGMGSQDDWLITPAIDLTDMNARIKWVDKVESATRPNDYKVLVSTTTPDIASFTIELADISCTNTSWVEHILSLGDFEGETIYIAFYQYFSTSNVWGFGIDNVILEETPNTFAVTFAVEDENGVAVTDAIVTLDGVAQAAGEYVFEVEPGTYDYTVAKAGYQSTTGSVVVVDAPVAVNAVINQLFAISFVVEDEAAAALENVQIVIADEDETVLYTEMTDDAGEAEVILIAGNYTYSVSLIGFIPEEAVPFTVSADAVIEIAMLVAPPTLSIVPETNDFGQVLLDTESAPQVFTITNIGSGILTINGIELPVADDQFILIDANDYTDGIDLATAETLTFAVVFAPTLVGAQTGTLTVMYNNGVDNTFDVLVTGEGFDPIVSTFPYVQTFDAPVMPVAWSVEDNSGSTYTWQFPGTYAIVNSDAAGSGKLVHSTMYTPIFDVTDLENPRFTVSHYYRHLGAAAYGRVKIAIDGSEEWTTLAEFTSSQGSGSLTTPVYADVVAPLEGILDGGTTFQLAFEYNDGNAWAWYWLVNNFVVEETPKHIVTFNVEGGNGTLTAQVDEVDFVSGDEVLEGQSVVFTSTPDLGYRVMQWTVNGVAVEDYTDATYTINNIAEATTVTVSFEAIPTYEVLFSAIGMGDLLATVEGDAILSGDLIFEGSDIVFTAVPDLGYRVLAWTVDGVVVDGFKELTWTLDNLMDVVNVTVEFEETPPFYTVTFNVTDFDLTPLVGADVVITGLLDAELVTDVNGVATIDLEDGDYNYTIMMMGYEMISADFSVEGMEITFDFELEDIVVDPTGLMVIVDETDALFSWNNPVDFADSFEDNNLDLWFDVIEGDGTPGDTGGIAHWHVAVPDGGGAAPDGALVAKANWGYDIDTWLISPLLLVENDATLSFDWNSSYYWSVDPNPNAELMIKISVDGGLTWTEIWNWQDIGVWTNFIWYNTVLDLSDYAGQAIHFAIHLTGNDNANVQLDNVVFGAAGKSGTFMASGKPEGIEQDARMSATSAKMNKAFLGYNVFLNGAEVATGVAETEYQFTNLPYGTHVAGVQAAYSSGVSEIVTTEFTIQLPVADPLTMATLLDKTGANLPAQIGTGGNARAAALYQDRYVIVPSREGSVNVWVWDSHNPHLAPVALDKGEDIIAPTTFPINYVRTTETAIYVSNLSLDPSGGGWGQGVFQVYRWTDLEGAPEVVVSYNALPGRLGDAFSIVGDPEGDGHIIAHINTSKEFRIWNFENGVLVNEDTPDLFTLDVEFAHINNHGIINPIEGEDDIFVLTSNNIGIMIVNLDGDVLAQIDTDVIDMRTYDPNIFYLNGNRYLSYTMNNEANADIAARYQIVDISMGETVIEAINFISSQESLANRIVYDKQIADAGHVNLTATNQVAIDEDGELIILAHVVGKGFILETTGTLPATYALTVEAAPVEGGAVTGSGDYYEGATVPVTATSAAGFMFVDWTVGTDVVSTEASFNYTMPAAATTLVANFEPLPIVDVATLAELRAMPADGSLYRYTGDAVIVAMDAHRNRKFIQDATAAIMIDDNAGTITTDYDLYDVITNVVGDVVIFRDMVQFRPAENSAPSTANTPVNPAEFMLDEVTQGDQAKLIQFRNVTFTGITEGQVFANGTNYTITDGTNDFVVRTDFFNVDYIGEEIPTDPQNISGVVITFFETLQLVPRFMADMEDWVETFAVTFNVDMTNAEGFDPATDVVYITGSMLSWATPGDQPADQTMTRVDASMIWTKTLQIAAGTYEYKYFLNAGWDGGEWQGEVNRDLEVVGEMTVNDMWGTTSVNDLQEVNLKLFPNPARDQFSITAGSMIRNIMIVDITGKVVYSNLINDTQYVVYSQFDTGIYLVRIYTDEGVFVRKLQIQK